MRPPRTFALLLLALSAACGGPDASRPDVLLVTLDTTRADALDPEGPHAHLCPNVRALAAAGTWYAGARTVAPITLPAHASMLTGLVPPRSSVRLNGAQALPEDAVTLAELARAAGYRTAAFLGAVVLDARYGLDQGFEHYGEVGARERAEIESVVERPAVEVVDDALAWLAATGDAPRFAWVHLFDPHQPYAPPARHLEAAGGDAYLGEVAYLDAELGRLLAGVDLSSTVVLLVGDHGEGRGDKGEETHGSFAFESTLRVPFLLRRCGGGPAARVDAPVSVVDVLPTLAGAMGVAAPPDLDGVDLGAGVPPAERGLYFETYLGTESMGWAPLAGWVQDGWKLVQSSESELYGLGEDPGETRDRVAEPAQAERVRALRRALGAALERPALEPRDADVDAGALEVLRGLGYVGVEQATRAFQSPFEETERPAPHSQVENLAAFQRAHLFAKQGRFEESLALLERLVREAPEHGAAWHLVAGNRIRLGRFEEGLAAARRNLELQGEHWGAHLNLGAALDGLGRLDEALPHLERTVALNPAQDGVLARLEAVFRTRGDAERAQRYGDLLRRNVETREASAAR